MTHVELIDEVTQTVPVYVTLKEAIDEALSNMAWELNNHYMTQNFVYQDFEEWVQSRVKETWEDQFGDIPPLELQ
jgi:hypothetical protein